ncbi:hypothetical protein D3C72_1662600 [compost metagenome]
MHQLQAVADDDVDAAGQQHGDQLARILRAAVAHQLETVEGGLVGIAADLADDIGPQVFQPAPVGQRQLARGHEHGGAAAQRADQLVLRLALRGAGELERHLGIAQRQHLLHPRPRIQPQLVFDAGLAQHRLHHFHVQPARLRVFAVLETVRRELLVADHAPAAGQRRQCRTQQQAEQE